MPFKSSKKTRGDQASRKARDPLQAGDLYQYAVKLLGARMRTVRDLKRLLRKRAEEGETGEAAVEAVVIRLKQMNYLNDTRFAADFTRLRQDNEKFGQRRVQQDLMQKGIHSELIASTIKTAYEDVDEVELARRYIARKRMKPPVGPNGEKDDKLTTRAMRRLLRAGFSSQTIFKVLKSWGAGEDALEALADADDTAPIPDDD